MPIANTEGERSFSALKRVKNCLRSSLTQDHVCDFCIMVIEKSFMELSWNEDEGGQAEVVWTCHEERPRVCRKKDDGNGVTRKEEKRETKEKIFRCGKRRYEGSWCEGGGH